MRAFAHLDVETSDRIAVVTITRPDKLNALNSQVISDLENAFDALNAEDGIRGIILQGAGDRAFAAGADVAELSDLTPDQAREVSRNGQRVFDKIERSDKPVVAAVRGYALGGGCELALACHLRIASEDAQLGLPEVSLGILPAYGGTVRLTRLLGPSLAYDLILTGRTLDAARAHEIGLVHTVVPGSELLQRARNWLSQIADNGPLAVQKALEAVRFASHAPAEQALKHEADLFSDLAATEDMREGIQAFLEKRSPNFRGR